MKSKRFSTNIYPAIRATALRECCDDLPAILMISKTHQHLALCSACYLAFFWNAPQDIRTRYFPPCSHQIIDVLPDLREKKRFDPWFGNPDTDKHWANK